MELQERAPSNKDVRNSKSVKTDLPYHDDFIETDADAFGIMQGVIFVIAACTRLVAMWNLFSIEFLTPYTEFTCTVFNNDTYYEIEVDNSTCYDNCTEYIYYQEVFQQTLITEFGLICDDAWLGSFSQTVLMFGVMCGAFGFGWISDRFGRRKAYQTTATLNVVFMVSASFAPSYWTFNGLRFLIGICSGGIIVVSLVLVLEISGPKYREVVGCCALIPDGLSDATLTAFAYHASSWHTYHLAYSIASVMMTMLVFFIPESPRWLATSGKTDELQDVVAHFSQRKRLSIADLKDDIAHNVKTWNKIETVKSSYFDLFRNKDLSRRTSVTFVVFIVTGMSYYGISEYVTFVGADVYWSVTALGLIQVPIFPASIILCKKFERKKLCMGTFIATGMFMIILTVVPKEHWFSTAIGVLGMSAATATRPILYVYLSELFPTTIRTMAYGTCISGAELGAMAAPFIATLIPQWVPSLIFGLVPFFAAGICCLLPETKGQVLKDTID